VEPFELNPMALIQAQRDKIMELVEENLQLRAAVNQLQQQVAALMEVPGNNGEIADVTDQVVGAEITS
jgi:hypothetical protein